ncbi:MAG: T9SS type A sorting domain-containing protein [Balneolaceae bacterium]
MNKVTKKNVLQAVLTMFVALVSMSAFAQGIYFSEAQEGSSNNKALEIYNPTADTVWLDGYAFPNVGNAPTVVGEYEFWNDFPEGSYIAPGEFFIIAHPSADAAILDKADMEFTFLSNGDDGFALVQGDSAADAFTVIDRIGDWNGDPGDGWDVAGVTAATKDHTLLRKPSVTSGNADWTASAGTNAEDSEWIVAEQNFNSNLGYQTGAVSVTFNVNTATMPDTLMEDHVIQVRGGLQGSDAAGTGLGSMITWDSGSMVTENIGGDYWTITFKMTAGDTLNYKFWAGVDTETPLVNGTEQGWESGANNQFILNSDAVADTVLPLQWFETRAAPFTSESDSVTVFFRVNVGAQLQVGDFDPETDKVGVRGNGAFFAADWGTGNFLSEGATNGKNLFYEGIVRAQKDSVAKIEGSINYKFVIESGGDVTWESQPDRPITIPAADTTVHWVYFSDTRPSDQDILETNLNFEVNVGILEGLGFFNSSIDTVFVTGTFNAWNNSENQMAFNSFSGNYEASNLPFTTVAETQVAYKYFVKWDASRDDEESENFLSGITHDGSGWEEPGVTGGADRTFIIEDAADQPVRSEFYNGVEPKALLTSTNVDGGAITVTFSIDMSAAEENEAQPFLPATDSVYLFVDTPFFALTNGITVPGDNGENFVNTSDEEKERLRFTDADEDGVYELDLELTLPTLNHIGFRIAYGEPTSEDGSLFANGGGFAAGRRHYQYVQPMIDANLDVTWPSTFTMPTLTWQATNLDWDTPPDYSQMTTSNEEESGVAEVFSLDQNYPNPFNPTTNISFNLPNASNVTLAVYNLLGQKVATLIDGRTMTNGVHSVAFDARALSSGVYIYRLEAGSFVSNKRMTLIK